MIMDRTANKKKYIIILQTANTKTHEIHIFFFKFLHLYLFPLKNTLITLI